MLALPMMTRRTNTSRPDQSSPATRWANGGNQLTQACKRAAHQHIQGNSELHLYSKLDRTWTTYLVNRIQASETASKHHQRLSKQPSLVKTAFRVSEIRMIENIAHIRCSNGLVGTERLLEGRSPLIGARQLELAIKCGDAGIRRTGRGRRWSSLGGAERERNIEEEGA